jgi:ribosomal protein L25 (general stress protein Ctc)
MIPGVIYGVDEHKEIVSVKIMMPVKPLNKLIRDLKNSLENTVQVIKLDDNSQYLVTPRQLQIDPSTYLTRARVML